MLFFTEEKIAKRLAEVQTTIYRETIDIPLFRFYEGQCPGAEQPDFDDAAWTPFRVGGYWGGYDVVAWFRTEVPIPTHFHDQKVALRFLVGPRDGGNSTAETLLYVDGHPLQAIDVWHEEAWLPPELLKKGCLHLALKAWSGVMGVPERRHFKLAQLVRIDPGVERFCFQAGALHKTIKELDGNDWQGISLLEVLNEACNRIDFTKPRSEAYYHSVAEAAELLEDRLHALQSNDPTKPTVIGVGHSHLDMVWLWRLRHTREKAARTFTTALHLMEQYPEYRYLHSSPQVYQYLAEDYPEIFERVKARIAAGDWEITGGMWVESDTNLPSGESLVRQFLLGRRYMREEFGVESHVLWLPDVFGYSWALPQIMRKSGIRYFVTSKISWNQFNRFPYDTFQWRGIDGTEVLTHFITTPEENSAMYTYIGQMVPREIKGIWDEYQQKQINNELLLPFGWGDGGGGPTKEMLEEARAMRNIPGLPQVKIDKVEPYLARLEKRLRGQDVPVWDDELYLEYHRGTYTTQAANKRANRKAEILYHDAEWLNTLADLLTGQGAYPANELRIGWKLMLLNQFHDMLPGSSIREANEDAGKDYERIGAIGSDALERAQKRILDGIATERAGLVVFNPLAWEQGGLIEVPQTSEIQGKALQLADGRSGTVQAVGENRLLMEVDAVPALGYRFYPLVEAEKAESGELMIRERHLENRYYQIDLNEAGQITSLYDKVNKRQVLAAGERGNVLQAFEDKPLGGDAWDIDPFYPEKMQIIDDLEAAEIEEAGPLRAVLRLTWRFYDSVIRQRLTIYRDNPRIDFRTEIDWHEQHIMLKAAFPVAVRATRATYDIQFGNIERPTHRNTSWDYARFEVVGHKWVDLSEGNYGVSLLNDCKYGHDIKDHVMRLTLLRSSTDPDPLADQGQHTFTYSLLPHGGTWRQAETVYEGYALNDPLGVDLIAGPQPGTGIPQEYGFAHLDADHVILETVKQAEDRDAWIVRVYEYKQYRASAVRLSFAHPIRRAVECNLVEEGETPVQVEQNQIVFPLDPYEIKTFKIWFD